MKQSKTIFTINTSESATKIALYKDGELVFGESIPCEDDRAERNQIHEQFYFRQKVIDEALKQSNIDMNRVDAIGARGGLLKPLSSGVHKINDDMVQDIRSECYGSSAINLGILLADTYAKKYNLPAYIADPIVLDEMTDLAKVSGLKGIERISIVGALNQRYVGHLFAEEHNTDYGSLNLIIANMNSEMSIGIHEKGKLVDVINSVQGEGPFTGRRSGGISPYEMVDLCYSGKYSESKIKKLISKKGGLTSYLGTEDVFEVEKMIQEGNEEALFYIEAMAYQIAKSIASGGAVLKGTIDGVILTGKYAYYERLNELIRERVSYLGEVAIYPGQDESLGLAKLCTRVLNGEEEALEYNSEYF